MVWDNNNYRKETEQELRSISDELVRRREELDNAPPLEPDPVIARILDLEAAIIELASMLPEANQPQST